MRRQRSGETQIEDAESAEQLAVEEPEEVASEQEAKPASTAAKINPNLFRRRLMAWYRLNARALPWRNTSDPYHIWVSEIMLQQTRVAAVIEHYHEFLRRFPTLIALALAKEADVLAAWSGLGYYRRARMLHKAAQFLMLERGGDFPAISTELRTLPGIGEYTAAAIASIAFGESIAVVDGNVERVLLRLTGFGEAEDSPRSAQTRAFVRTQAQALVPARYVRSSLDDLSERSSLYRAEGRTASERVPTAAAAHPDSSVASAPYIPHITNAAGDHNQAMMELGATICLPRSPLCLECPVYALCRMRGEHSVPPRPQQLSRPIAYLLDLRKRRSATEILLERRAEDVSLMPGMFELPPLPLEAVVDREPILRVRHSITNTNYYVQVHSTRRAEQNGAVRRVRSSTALLRAVPLESRDLRWVRTSHLGSFPLTGLARKVLQRLNVIESARLNVLD